MNHATSTRFAFRIVSVFLMMLLASGVSAGVGQEPSGARKFDQFEDFGADDTEAHLDNFALELLKNPDSDGVIVGYYHAGSLRGLFLREFYGYREYLVGSRGIQPNRVSVVEGGDREKMLTELWILAPGASLPKLTAETAVEPNSPAQFDRISATERRECTGDFALQLYKVSDALRFFGESLKANPKSKAWIVVHPHNRETLISVNAIIRRSKDSLLRDYGIEPQRILTAIGDRRSSLCTEVNFWLAPAQSMKADEAGYYAGLIREAETTEYTVRRVEFSGNVHIRDSTLRRGFLQQEGDVFSKKLGVCRKNKLADVESTS